LCNGTPVPWSQRNKERIEFLDYLSLLVTDYNFHLLSEGPRFVSLFYFFNKFGVSLKPAWDLVLLKINDPVFCLLYLRQIAWIVGVPFDKFPEKLVWNVESISSYLEKNAQCVKSPEELGNMLRDNNLPPLFIIDFNDSELTVVSHQLKIRTITALFLAIKLSFNLKSISLTSKNIDPIAALILADSFVGHTSLMNFSLNETNIGTEGMSPLMHVMSELNNLTRMSLDFNRIGSKTMFILPPNLVELDLSNNNVGNDGFRKIAELFLENNRLQSFSCSGDISLSNEGILALGDALKNNNTILNLNLSYANSDITTINQFLALVSSSSLKQVDFSNVVSDVRQKALLVNNTNIKVIL